jgi:formylglycine-generating enzyme required for sulfatase activity
MLDWRRVLPAVLVMTAAAWGFAGSCAGWDLGVRVELSGSMVHPGEEFWVRGGLRNPGPGRLEDVPVFFVLAFGGDLWFWPSWVQGNGSGAGGLDFELMDVPVGGLDVEVVPSFVWPDTGDASLRGIYLFGAMLTPDGGEVLGDLGVAEFGYGPWGPPRIDRISRGSGPPGTLIRIEGREFQLFRKDVQALVGGVTLPFIDRGVLPGGEEYAVTVLPYLAPGEHEVLVVVGGRASDPLSVEITDLPPTGRPPGQVLQELSTGFSILSGAIGEEVIPEAVDLGLVPVDSEVALRAGVSRAVAVFRAFEGLLASAPEDELEEVEALLVRNGLDEVFRELARGGERGRRGEGRTTALADLCLSLDVTSAALSALDSAWSAAGITALTATIAGGGISPRTGAGVVGLHFAIEGLDALLDGLMRTDLEGFSFLGHDGPIPHVVIETGRTSRFVTLGTFDNQAPPSDATFEELLEGLMGKLPLVGSVEAEVVRVIREALQGVELDLESGVLAEELRDRGDLPKLTARIDLEQLAGGFDLRASLGRTVFGPLDGLAALMEELGGWSCDSGVYVEYPELFTYDVEGSDVLLVGLEDGVSGMKLTGPAFRPIDPGSGAPAGGAELPREAGSWFLVTVRRGATTPTPTPTEVPSASPTAAWSPRPSATPTWGSTPAPTVQPTNGPTGTPTPPLPTPPPAPAGFELIPAGTFLMGSPPGELCRDADETQHAVTLTQAFYIQGTEVTQAQWEELFGVNPSQFEGANLPVESVTWYDAVIYCNRLSLAHGLRPSYYADAEFTEVFDGEPPVHSGTVYWDRDAPGYRLPTEAEWEYACRAGTGSAYNSGDENTDCLRDDVLEPLAWYWFSGDMQTHEVGEKEPNAWGLYDMHGNAMEWCWDWYAPFGGGSQTDPIGPDTGSERVARSGGWGSFASGCRSAFRQGRNPAHSHGYIGFRVARNAAP